MTIDQLLNKDQSRFDLLNDLIGNLSAANLVEELGGTDLRISNSTGCYEKLERIVGKKNAKQIYSVFTHKLVT